MSIIHEQGATEGYGYGDASFVEGPAPALDIWSEVNFDPYKLKVNSLPPESMTTIYDKISGRELPNPIDNELQFGIYDPKGENNFANKNIFADLYDSTHNLIGTYDIKNMVSTGTTIPLTISNGLSYTMDVRFEPNTFKFKDLANFADHWLQQCNIDNNKCDGLGEDGEYLNFIDFAYWANKWNPNN
jgi:hypothetical protein